MSEEISETKTFTQAEIDNIVETRLMRERSKHTETINSLQLERDGLKSELESQKLNSLKSDLLSKAGLSSDWGSKISGKTEEEIQTEIASFKQLIENSKTSEPIGSGTNPADQKPVTFYTRAQIQKMTPEEINANWENVQKSLKRAGI